MTIRHGEARPASAPDARLTTSHFVDAGDARIHVLEQGSGDTTALLIPGITGTAAALGALAECLATELRVVWVDPRGRGMSSTPTEPTYSLADYTGDISTVLSKLTDRPPTSSDSPWAPVSQRARGGSAGGRQRRGASRPPTQGLAESDTRSRWTPMTRCSRPR